MEKPIIAGINYNYDIEKGFHSLNLGLFLGDKADGLLAHIKDEFASLDALLGEQFCNCVKKDRGQIYGQGKEIDIMAGYAYVQKDCAYPSAVCELEFRLCYTPASQINILFTFLSGYEKNIWTSYDKIILRYEMCGKAKSAADKVEYLRKNKGTITPQSLLAGKDKEVCISAISKL